MLEAYEEHHAVKLIISELEQMEPHNERFLAKATLLEELIQHHVEEEETAVFPECEKEMDARVLDQIARQIVDEKTRMEKKGLKVLITMLRDEVEAEVSASRREQCNES